MSWAWSYCNCTRITSGARYHLEPMWSVIHLSPLLIVSVTSFIFFTNHFFVSSFKKCLSKLSCDCMKLRTREVLQLPFPIRFSGIVLETPKSPIFTCRSLVKNILAGLISLCIMLQEWRNFMADRVLNIIFCKSSYFIVDFFSRMYYLKSIHKYSIIMKTCNYYLPSFD